MSQIFVPFSGSTSPSNVPTSFVTDNGTAIPLANVLNVLGASGTVTSGSGNTVTVTSTANGNVFALVSPIINFKIVTVTTLFSIPIGFRFAPVFTQMICESATAANINGNFSVGWTPATYSDYIASNSFGPNVANMSELYQTGSTPVTLFPSNTDIKINVTSADTGTALTGRIVIYGIYI
jgi:hypothetical protein